MKRISDNEKTKDIEILDWDVYIKEAPPRPSGTIEVKLEYAGGGVAKALFLGSFRENIVH